MTQAMFDVATLAQRYGPVIDKIHRQLLPQRLQRYRWFFSTPGRGRLLIQIHLPMATEVVTRPPPEADLQRDLDWLLAEHAARFFEHWRRRPPLDDDLLPCSYFSTGIAEEGAYWGAQVIRTEQTSWLEPVLPDLSPASLARLRLDPTRLWARCPLRAIRGLAELGVPTGPRGLFGPFDLACAARGHDLLAELLQQPAGAHRLLSLATEAAAWWARQQLAASPAPQGGTILPYFGLWLPWRAAGHVSVDYAVMVSPHLLDQFVFRYERHFASQFQAAAYHIHNVGWHTLAGVCTIERMVLLEVTDDPGVPRTAERYGQLLECAGQLPLLLYPTPQEVYDHIDLLAQHNVILSLTAANLPPDRAEQVARDLIRLVRDRSKPPAS